MNSFIRVMFCAAILVSSLAYGIDEKLLELRPVTERPTATSEPLKDPSSDHMLNIEKTAIINARDIKSVHVNKDSAIAALSLTLSETGSTNLRKYTATHIAKRLAIVVKGSVVAAPIIRDEIKGGHIEVSGLDRASAEQLAKEINGIATK